MCCRSTQGMLSFPEAISPLYKAHWPTHSCLFESPRIKNTSSVHMFEAYLK
ncbi:hypothetical protein EXN66_Car008019 [Channa argus]|uniref:Uncharacterized protein n=1 Tax=Channa argus TaxID=215402 RepID=A0A6G1PQ85_CHAAH|nr:hypothetical protein EXN66_Car008019 [Channa argus]